MSRQDWAAQLRGLARQQARLRPERVCALYLLSPFAFTLLLSTGCGVALLQCWMMSSVVALVLGGLPALGTGLMALLLRRCVKHQGVWVGCMGVVGYVTTTLVFGLYDEPMSISLRPNELSWIGAIMAVLVSLLIVLLERRLRRRLTLNKA